MALDNLYKEKSLYNSDGPLGVSVIIPVHRVGRELFEAINSVYRQGLDLSQFEIIVVDDGCASESSPEVRRRHEKTMRILKGMVQKSSSPYPNLTIETSCVRGVNRGQSVAKNTGVMKARFPLVACLDSDDMYVFDKCFNSKYQGSYLQHALAILGQHGDDVALVDCNFYLFGAGIDKPDIKVHTAAEIHSRIRHKKEMSNKAVFWRSDFLNVLNDVDDEVVCGFHPQLKKFEDTIFFMQLLTMRMNAGRSIDIIQIPYPFYLYRQHPAQVGNVSGSGPDTLTMIMAKAALNRCDPYVTDGWEHLRNGPCISDKIHYPPAVESPSLVMMGIRPNG